MTRPTMHSNLLPSELMHAQLSQIDLLRAMYPGDGELLVDEATNSWLQRLEEWCQDGDDNSIYRSPEAESLSKAPIGVPEYLSLVLNLTVDGGVGEDSVEVSINVPTRQVQQISNDDSQLMPAWKIRLRQPSWMSKAQSADINTSVARECEKADVFSGIEHLKEEVARQATTDNEQKPTTTSPAATADGLTQTFLPTTNQSEVRVWFYFPSLSTRSKRNDLVNSAPDHRLTGFVLAGKPGILCLEGLSKDIDDYMKYIKTESWGDIPSHHKKVSERYREPLVGTGWGGRLFKDMQEITDQAWMGEKRGERGNRNDLRVLEGWLKEMGLDGVLQKVLM